MLCWLFIVLLVMCALPVCDITCVVSRVWYHLCVVSPVCGITSGITHVWYVILL